MESNVILVVRHCSEWEGSPGGLSIAYQRPKVDHGDLERLHQDSAGGEQACGEGHDPEPTGWRAMGGV